MGITEMFFGCSLDRDRRLSGRREWVDKNDPDEKLDEVTYGDKEKECQQS
jgi:hypothetical protein